MAEEKATIQGLKITTFAKRVADLPDRPEISADALKAWFDSSPEELREAFNGLIDALTAKTGAGEINTKDAISVQVALDRRIQWNGEGVKYIRLNSDGMLETSEDGVAWKLTGSGGHIILDKNGAELPQRPRMIFDQCEITDDGEKTIVHGIKGDKGDKGDTGAPFTYEQFTEAQLEGLKGPQGETGPCIVPKVDQNTGMMSFSIQKNGVVPSSVNVRGPQGIQGIAGPTGPQGIQGERGPRGETGAPFTYEQFTEAQLEGLKGPQGDLGPCIVPSVDMETGVMSFRINRTGSVPSSVNVRGPQGIQGIAGPTGPQGIQGERGPRGETGAAFTYEDFTAEQLEGLRGPIGHAMNIVDIYPTVLDLKEDFPRGTEGVYFIRENSNLYLWSKKFLSWEPLGEMRIPLKGIDYWTAEDKAEIVSETLALLPTAEGVKY